MSFKHSASFTALLLILILSCSTPNQRNQDQRNLPKQDSIIYTQTPIFQHILDSVNVTGSILIFDFNHNIYYSNDFDWANKQKLPASTFKICNSIIALETKVVEDDSTLFKWDGTPRRLKIWEQDLIFREAFHRSCVPCYQEIAQKVGTKKMNEFLKKLQYGNGLPIDSNNLQTFWLEGDFGISPFEQITFLKNFYTSKLPISKKTELIMKRLMVIEDNASYTISGKTGWSIRNGNNNGWFVGYLETTDNVFFFATNIDPNTEFNMDLFGKIRTEITLSAFEKLDFID